MFNQVKKYAQQIRNDKLEGKYWIYVKNGNVSLIDRLPKEYHIKGDILVVDNPEQYLFEVNKRKATDKELKEFIWIGELNLDVNVDEDETIYGEVIPPELIRSHLLTLPVEDIVRSRRTSKEFKNVIDDNKFWCEVYERDYPNIKYDKNKCLKEYQEKYKWTKYLTITEEQLQECANKTNTNINDAIHLIHTMKFEKHESIFYFDPKNITLPINIIEKGKNKTESYFVLYSRLITFERPLVECLVSLTKGLIKNGQVYGRYFAYISFKDYINLYERMYGKDSFNKDYLTELNRYDRSKNNVDSQEVLAKFRKLAK